MKRFINKTIVIGLLVASLAILLASHGPSAEPSAASKSARQLFEAGNFMDAYQKYRQQTLDPKSAPQQVGSDLQMALDCLRRLGRHDEIDEFREKAIAAHPANWRLLGAAANSFDPAEGQGFIVAGEFFRGQRRGGGQYVGSQERDRVRSLQLYLKAIGLIEKEEGVPPTDAAQLHADLAKRLLQGREDNEAWRLQYATDLEQLPDYEPGWHHGGN